MTVHQSFRRIRQATVGAGNVVAIELPKAHYRGSLEIHGKIAVSVSSGGVTVVDSTLGGIPLITRIQVMLDGRTVPLDISGKFLDYWSHVDRPASERMALGSTTDGDRREGASNDPRDRARAAHWTLPRRPPSYVAIRTTGAGPRVGDVRLHGHAPPCALVPGSACGPRQPRPARRGGDRRWVRPPLATR